MKVARVILLIVVSISSANLQAVEESPAAPVMTEQQEYEILMEELANSASTAATTVTDTVHETVTPTSEAHYGYESTSEFPPERWNEIWPNCGGTKESPINLILKSCKVDRSRYPLRFYNFDRNPTVTNIHNAGHTVMFSFTFRRGAPYVSRGILQSKRYNFAQLHFHFGKSDESGSEHTVDNKPYALELHMVFFKAEYGTIDEASQHEDGLIVIATLFEVGNVPNKSFTKHLGRVIESGQTEILNKIPGSRLIDFIGSYKSKYVRYSGSLTTPPCSETVTWYVSTIPRKISHDDLKSFRALKGDGGHSMGGNNRPVQAMNGRKCYIR
ncbi:Carbonic anhydrase [Sergentomyia squamirostris]